MLWLSPSQSSQVTCQVDVVRCLGPLSASEWEELRSEHLVDGRRPYDRTYAWQFSNVRILEEPIDIQRKRGSVIFQVGPGM